MKIFWLIWILTLFLFLFKPLEYGIFEAIIFLALFTLIGFLAHSFDSNKKSLKKVTDMVERIDLTPLEEFVKKYNSNSTKLEKGLEEYKQEQEKKYRDIVRKVLEMDNKLNTKFKLLGEAMLELKEERND